MEEDKQKEIWKYLQKSGDILQPNLPPSPHHPKGRNAYAHIAICIKQKFGMSYKDIPNEKFDEVIRYIDFLVKNPN